MAQFPFPIRPEYTAVAIAYRNRKLIGDLVLPRVPVSSQEFRYLLHRLEDGFTIPDTKVGRKSSPNEVDFTASEQAGKTDEYGLDDVIPQRDIDNAPPNFDPMARATEFLTDLIMLDREKRVADLVFAAGTYPAANKATLVGADQFTDAASHPLKLIRDALDSVVMRPTIGVIGRQAFNVLCQHKDVVQAAFGSAQEAGVVPVTRIAELLELEALYVGEAWLNTAKKGQTKNLARVWGKHMAFVYRDTLADVSRGTTFGLTGQLGTRIAGSMPEPKVGLKGGQRVRVGEEVKELITAPDLGYFLQNVIP
jgi:hypothetical protein